MNEILRDLPMLLLGAWVLCFGVYLTQVLLGVAMLRSGNFRSVKIAPGWLVLGAILFTVWVFVR